MKRSKDLIKSSGGQVEAKRRQLCPQRGFMRTKKGEKKVILSTKKVHDDKDDERKERNSVHMLFSLLHNTILERISFKIGAAPQ
jgi:hypothetical protein